MEKQTGIAYYRQIADILITRIYNGGYMPGQRLPTDRQLSDEFGHNRHTVRRALDIVEAHKLITRRQGKGTFVVEHIPQREPKTQLPAGLIDITQQLGIRPAAEVLRVAVQPAGPLAAVLCMPGEARVTYMHRVRYLHGEPAIVEDIYVPQALCPGLEQHDLSQSLLILTQDTFAIEVTHKEIAFESVLANEHIAQLLKLSAGWPMMLEKRVLYTRGDTPCQYAEHVYRGDRFSFVLR